MKQGDEWGDPQNCVDQDNCHYCHTRTEQQFHPEIYKSTKCNDVQQTNFCPRGPFCAFAHNDQEMNAERELSLESSDLANILSTAFATSGINSALDKSALNASTNSNNSTNGISSLVNRNQQQLNQFQSSNSISIAGSNQQINNNGNNNGAFMPSSVPTHFGFTELAASVGLRSQPSGLGAFRRETSPPMLNNHNNLGPIARPRSYSSSHTSNLHHNLNSVTRENFLNSYLKSTIEEKTAATINGLNQQQQQNVLPLRKVSTPSTLFAANQQQQFNALQSNLVNTSSSQHLASSMQNSTASQFFQNLDSTSTTVESVVHSLALDDLTLDDFEESLEKDLLNHQALANSSLQDIQQQASGNNSTASLVRSSSNLMNNNGSTAPVAIPKANQRAEIANLNSLNSPLVGFGQSPLNHNVSSSVGSSLYDFASHSGMSPNNQQHQQQQQQQQLNLIQQQQNHQQQALLVSEIHRLRDELNSSRQACEFWKKEALKKDSNE